MQAATYTNITKSEAFNDESMSIGFRRFFCLPARVKTQLSTAYLLEFKSANSHDYMVNFFGSMTEQEYKQWVLTH